jgi:hypothetical protein
VEKRDIEKNKHLSQMTHKYVLIPDVDNGNFLVKYEKGYRAYTDKDLTKKGLTSNDVKPDEKKAWKWIENLFIKLVDERHEMLDEPKKSNISSELPKDSPEIIQNDPVEPKLPEGPSQLISQ